MQPTKSGILRPRRRDVILLTSNRNDDGGARGYFLRMKMFFSFSGRKNSEPTKWTVRRGEASQISGRKSGYFDELAFKRTPSASNGGEERRGRGERESKKEEL